MLPVRNLRENPERGIELSPRTCGRILAINRALYRLPAPARSPREPRPMPFKARHRHPYWTVDIRYTVSYQPDQRQLTSVIEQQLFKTLDRSAQLPLWEGRAEDWLTVIRLPPYALRRPKHLPAARQTRLFPTDRQSSAVPGGD